VSFPERLFSCITSKAFTYYQDDEIKKDEMSGAYSTHEGDEKKHKKF
jgi:hypothetical protein